jgi:phage gp16-like protein
MATIQDKLDQAASLLAQIAQDVKQLTQQDDSAVLAALNGVGGKVDGVASQAAANGSALSAIQGQVAQIAQDVAAIKAQVGGESPAPSFQA